jgi:hypothetical protein
VSAFRGDLAVKASLLAAMDCGEPTPLVSHAIGKDLELISWAQDAGLPASLVMLTNRLGVGGSSLVDPSSIAFARDLVATIAPGDELDRASNLWMVWAWEAAPERLCNAITSPTLLDLAAEAMDLHRRVAANGEVSRGDWRAMRARINRLTEGADDQARAAAVIAASLWDYRAVPGAAVDAEEAWESMLIERVRDAEAWGEAEDARYEGMLAEIRPVLLERIGPRPDPKDVNAFSEYATRLHTELAALMGAFDDPLWGRNKVLQHKTGLALKTLREQGRLALISLVRAGTTPQRNDPSAPQGLASHA